MSNEELKPKHKKLYVWTFCLRKGENGLLEVSKEPIQLQFTKQFLRDVHYGERDITRLDMTETNSILLLFRDKAMADSYSSAVSLCLEMINHEDFWENLQQEFKNLDTETSEPEPENVE